MKISTAFHYLKCGYKIRREAWENSEFISNERPDDDLYYFLLAEDILAEDWVIIVEKDN